MTQVDQGIRGLLTSASNYDLFQGLVGAKRVRRSLSVEYIQANPGMKILDIGCGTGGILADLPDVDYLGFDLNQKYLEAATQRYGARGRFICADVNDAPTEIEGVFDRVLALGLLHHLEDEEVFALMALSCRLLAPGGKLITIDPCYRDGQPTLARFLINRDRGRNARTEQGYVELARTAFQSVEAFIREDLLRVPYTHVILRCGLDTLAQG